MRTIRPAVLALAIASLATLAAGCGGGGGGGGDRSSGLALSASSIEVTTEQGVAGPARSIDLTLSDTRAAAVGAFYPAGQVQPSWIDFALTAVDATHFRLDLSTNLDPFLLVGTYATTFLVGTADANQNVLESHPVTVTLHVIPRAPYLTGSTPQRFSFVEADGTQPGAQFFSLGVGGTTPRTCQATITVQDDGGWLQVTPPTRTLGDGSTGFIVQALPGAPAGTHAGQIGVQCLVDGVDLGSGLAIPVTFDVDEHRLVPSAVGVSLVKTPTRSALARQIDIGDSLGRREVPWTATADQAWLTVTPSGTAPGALTLTADPAGLGAGTHLAWITLSSSDASVGSVERIRVGLSILAADPAPAFQAGYFGALAASPVEPIVFAASSGGADVVGFDANGGAAVRTFPHVATTASALTLSGDGTLLYVWDSAAFQVLELDAATGAIQRRFDSALDWLYAPDAQSGLAWVHPAGRPELLAPSAAVYDLSTGLKITEPFVQAVQGGGLVATADGTGVVTGSDTLFALHRTTVPSLRSWATRIAGPEFSPSYNKACPSADGWHLYAIGGGGLADWSVAAGAWAASYPVPASEAVVLRRPVCTTSGLLVTGGQSYPGGHDLWVFAPPSTTPVASLYSTGAVSTDYGGLYDLAVTADATRLVAFSAPQSGPPAGLYFLSLPPAP